MDVKEEIKLILLLHSSSENGRFKSSKKAAEVTASATRLP